MVPPLVVLLLVSLCRICNTDSLPTLLASWKSPDEQVHRARLVNWYPIEATVPQFHLVQEEDQANGDSSKWSSQNAEGTMQQVGAVDTGKALPLLLRGTSLSRLRTLKKITRKGIGWQPLKRDVLSQLSYLDQTDEDQKLRRQEILQGQTTDDVYNAKYEMLNLEPSMYSNEAVHRKQFAGE
uniref:Uncharacterized protein n=1 Tax=Trichuris muris TaxID=70415 RepID=A0A5S6QDU2_TRIMR